MNELSAVLFTFGFTVVLIPLLIPLSLRIGLIDRPGGHKTHESVTPLIGGLALFASVLLVQFALGERLPGGQVAVAVLFASALIAITGAFDDWRPMPVRVRMLAQILATLLVVHATGLYIGSLGNLLGGWPLEFGLLLGLPLTVFATVGGINAMNMADGLDGLAGGLALMTLIMLGIVASVAGAAADAYVLLALCGGVAGFLAFNLRCCHRARASVFLGDAGSMLLGFCITWFLIDLSQGENPAMTPVTALWIFALPLMDTIGVMLRRVMRGESPFRPGRDHLHHVLLASGFSVTRTVFILIGLHAAIGALGLVGLYAGVPEAVMFYAFAGLFSLYFWAMRRAWQVMRALRAITGAVPHLPLKPPYESGDEVLALVRYAREHGVTAWKKAA